MVRILQLPKEEKSLGDILKEGLVSELGRGAGRIGSNLVEAGIGGLGSYLGRKLGIDERSQIKEALKAYGYDENMAEKYSKFPLPILGQIIRGEQKNRQENATAQAIRNIIQGNNVPQNRGVPGMPQEAMTQEMPQQMMQMPAQANMVEPSKRNAIDIYNQMLANNVSPSEASKSARPFFQAETIEQRRMAPQRKEIAKLLTQSNEAAVNAKDIVERVNEYEKLIKSGKMPTYLEGNILGISRIPFLGGMLKPMLNYFFQNPTGEQADKITSSFVVNASNVLQNATNQQLTAYMKGIPSLMMSDYGKSMVDQQLLRFSTALIERNKILQEVADEYPNASVATINRETDKRFDPYRKKFEDQFEQNMRDSAAFLDNNPQYRSNEAIKFIKTIGAAGGSTAAIWALAKFVPFIINAANAFPYVGIPLAITSFGLATLLGAGGATKLGNYVMELTNDPERAKLFLEHTKKIGSKLQNLLTSTQQRPTQAPQEINPELLEQSMQQKQQFVQGNKAKENIASPTNLKSLLQNAPQMGNINPEQLKNLIQGRGTPSFKKAQLRDLLKNAGFGKLDTQVIMNFVKSNRLKGAELGQPKRMNEILKNVGTSKADMAALAKYIQAHRGNIELGL